MFKGRMTMFMSTVLVIRIEIIIWLIECRFVVVCLLNYLTWIVRKNDRHVKHDESRDRSH